MSTYTSIATAHEHLRTIEQHVAALMELPEAALESLYEHIQEADDALTDALNESAASVTR